MAKKESFVKFTRRNSVDYENFVQVSDFVPNKEVSIAQCVANGVVPPEAANLEYDSDENGENVSFDDAQPIIPDKIAALERMQELERDYIRAKADKEAADKAVAEATKMAQVVGNESLTAPVGETKPTE